MTNQINQIILGDSLKELPKLPAKSANLIIADPPYYKTINEKWDFKWRTEQDYLLWAEKWIRECSRISKSNGSFWIFGYVRILSRLLPIVEKYGFSFRQQIVISKGLKSISGRKTSTYKMFPTTTESIFFFVKNNQPYIKNFLKKQNTKNLSAKEINEKLGAKSNGGGLWSLYTGNNISAQIPTETMWKKLEEIFNFKKNYLEVNFVFNRQLGFTDVWDDINFYEEKRIHPTQKPLKLIERLIIASSNEGDLVLDPFFGSGSILKSARKLRRNFIGIEIDEYYYNLAQKGLNMVL